MRVTGGNENAAQRLAEQGSGEEPTKFETVCASQARAVRGGGLPSLSIATCDPRVECTRANSRVTPVYLCPPASTPSSYLFVRGRVSTAVSVCLTVQIRFATAATIPSTSACALNFQMPRMCLSTATFRIS